MRPVALNPTPEAQAVAVAHPRTEELKRYWVNLTTKGFSGANPPENLTPMELTTAFTLGKLDFPKGDESLMAFFFNAHPLFCRLQVPPPRCSTITLSTPLGQFFVSHDFNLIVSVLQLVGYLEASNGSHCRRVSEELVEIRWDHDPPLYLVLPLDLTHTLENLSHNLKVNEPATLACLAKAMALFLPTLPAAPPQTLIRAAQSQLIELYQGFCRYEDFATATRFLFLLKCAGWDPADIVPALTLPDLIDKPGMKEVFAGTRFAPLIEKESRQEVFEELLTCRDLSVLSKVWSDEQIEKRPEFLERAAATMPEEALPFALCLVCKLCDPKAIRLSPEERLNLLGAYLIRMKGQNPPFSFAISYEPKVRELIDHHLRDLSSSPRLADLLVKEALGWKRWDRLALLLIHLQKGDSSLEEVVKVLETVATVTEATPCFEMRITRPGQRLSREQKFRVAKAYATFAQLTGNSAVMREPLDQTWILGQLRKEDSWQQFTRFCVSQGIAREEHARWVAPMALASAEPCRDFEVIVESLDAKSLDQAMWKPILTEILLRNPANLSLFDKLLSLTSGTEKECLQQCRALGVEERKRHLETYKNTGSIAELIPRVPTLEEQIDEALTQNDHCKALALLKKAPPPSWELWDRLIRSAPPKELLEEIWKTWLQNHPIEQFKLADEPYWLNAIQHLLAKLEHNAFVDFFLKEALTYAERLEGESSSVFTPLCLNNAIHFISNQAPPNRTAILHQIRAFDLSPALIQKFGNPTKQLQFEFQAVFNLSLAQQREEALSAVGLRWCLEQMEQAKSGDLTNIPKLLKFYSQYGFVPKTPQAQEIFLEWIDLCASQEFFTQLSWLEKNLLLTTLCSFNSPSQKGSECDHRRIENLWEQLLFTYRNHEAEVRKRYAELFFLSIKNYLNFSMRNYPEDKFEFLEKFRQMYKEDFEPYLPEESLKVVMRKRVELFLCSLIFSIRPLQAQPVTQALTDLMGTIPFLKTGVMVDSEPAVGAFRNAIPDILNLPDPKISPLVLHFLNNLMTFAWVQEASPGFAFGWDSILSALCSCMAFCENRRPEITPLVAEVFMNCTHPNRVKERFGKVDPHLINRCIIPMGKLFIAMPNSDCLSALQWHNLINGLSNESMEKMTSSLLAEKEQGNPNRSYLNILAVARIIRHTTVANPNFIKTVERLCNEGLKRCYLLLLKIKEPTFKLELIAFWILALSSHKGLNQKLTACKTDLTTKLTTLVCELINDKESFKVYSRFIIDALGNDPEVAKAMHAVLATIEKPELTELKKFVANKTAQ